MPSFQQPLTNQNHPNPAPRPRTVVLKRPNPHIDLSTVTDTLDVGEIFNRSHATSHTYQHRIGYQLLPFARSRIYDAGSHGISAMTILLVTISTIIGIAIGTYGTLTPSILFFSSQQTPSVAQAADRTGSPGYNNWMDKHLASIRDPQQDPDSDGLSNEIEHVLHSNPTSWSSCGDGIKDLDQVIRLINPGRCTIFNTADTTENNLLIRTLTDPTIAQRFIDRFNPDLPGYLIVQHTGEPQPLLDKNKVNSYIRTNVLPGHYNAPAITGDMIEKAIATYGTDSVPLLAMMHERSNFGSRQPAFNNPGLIGTQGKNPYLFKSVESGVNTLAAIIAFMDANDIPRCTTYRILTHDTPGICEAVTARENQVTRALN